MKGAVVRIAIAATLILAAAAPPVVAQDNNGSAPSENATLYTSQQLDQMLAPVALYPDPLLGQILMAATYPLEVVMAARWIREPDNAALKGDALQGALAQQDWAASVKSLIPFPAILEMMDGRLDWTQQLGDAFLAQQSDVMEAVQRLRKLAADAGNLPSNEQQTVTSRGQTIVIQPADPQVVYVPVYDPAIVFGIWPYPAFPPLYFPPPPGLYVGPSVITGFNFTVGIVTVPWLWGWNQFDWRQHRIHINPDRYDRIDTHRPPVHRDTWEHDRMHRRGVAYPTPRLRSRFESVHPPPLGTLRDFRGYERGVRPAPPAVRTPRAPHPKGSRGPSAPGERPGGVTHERPQARVPRPLTPHRVAPQAEPPAFEGFSTGDEARRDALRGRDSRSTMPQRRPAPQPAEITPGRQGEKRHGSGGGGRAGGGERRGHPR